ncbi:N-chimaerin-like isoform X3 [Tachypleus tridentatus]|uniref:N-chimaerin-like isoform X3 n=1 Tax=Tachypleus tridentatus TaxID=6853 RepID=UPI003FD3C866
MAYHRHHSFPSDVTHQEHQIGDDRRHRISSSSIPQLWKSYLYQLQQQAPTPKRIVCTREVLYRPFHYGREFHGRILREEADLLLQGGDGSYLVRESQRAPGQYTLSLRFGGMTKNYRLYYDGKHYVGEKKFHTVQDLVTDGLITLYLEANAGEYIAKMCVQSRYEQSPYMTLNSYKRKLQNMRVVKRRSMSNQGSKSNSLKSANECDRSEDGSINDGPVMAGLNVHRFEKPHNFKTHNFKGFPWCDLCGNFMWGIIAQGLKCEDCGFSAHRKCSENIPNDCLPDLKYVKRVFGIDLTTLVKAHNTPRPFVVDMCVKEIENRGLDAEGLYRVSGFSDEIEAVRLAFEKGKSTMEEKLDSIKEAVAKLPPAHYQTLKYLIQHLYRVTEKQKQNLMSIHNLGTVFCPTLMRTPDLISQPGQLSAWHQESLVIELLITHHRLLLDH